MPDLVIYKKKQGGKYIQGTEIVLGQGFFVTLGGERQKSPPYVTFCPPSLRSPGIQCTHNFTAKQESQVPLCCSLKIKLWHHRRGFSSAEVFKPDFLQAKVFGLLQRDCQGGDRMLQLKFM